MPGSERSRVRVVSRVWKNSVSVAMDWPSVPLLDQYLMREMVPVLVLAVGICATLGMSLGALAGLIREVAVSGKFFGIHVFGIHVYCILCFNLRYQRFGSITLMEV